MSDFQTGDIVASLNCLVQNMTVTGYVDGKVFCRVVRQIEDGNYTVEREEVFYPENLTLVHRDDPNKPTDVYSNVSNTEKVDLTEMIKNQVFKCENLLPKEEVKQETWRDRSPLL